MSSTQQILGIKFFDGDADQAVETMFRHGGFLVVPAAPALTKLHGADLQYRDALANADLAIADSGAMVLFWRILKGRKVNRISGLAYFKSLAKQASFREPRKSFFVLPNETAARKLLAWSQSANMAITRDNYYIAPIYGEKVADRQLLATIEGGRPAHIVIAIGNGPQEKLGHYLRDHLNYRPAIHCIGAALGFLTGDQVAIPDWADRLYLGWLFRLFAQPRIFIPRLARALALPWLMLRYGGGLPPLRLPKSRK